MRGLLNSSRVACTAVALLIVLAYGGTAKALTLDAVSGTWGNVVGGSNVVFETVGDENQVRWGVPTTKGGQSGLGFEGSAPPPFSFDVEEYFEVGTLRHFNQPVVSGTAASGVDLKTFLSFSDPAIEETLRFTFRINETLNIPPCDPPGSPACPDVIGLGNPFAREAFDIEGTLYTLQIVGFRETVDGPLVSQLISEEGGTASAVLVGRITADFPMGSPVPEPGALVLFCAGGLIVGSAIRRASRARG